MQNPNKTTSFLLPILNLDQDFLWSIGFESAYIGDGIFDNEIITHPHLLLRFEKELYDPIIENHSKFISSYTDGDFILIKFKFTEPQIQKIFTPFINGEYSKIDRSYVHQNFSRYTSDNTLSQNWRILTKDPSLKYYWEDRIGVLLPMEAEVWSKPNLEDEIYRYIS